MNKPSIRSSTAAVRGFTLIELMVALAIGLLMAFGLVRVFASSSESYRALSQASLQIENGRYAMQAISEDLRHAGFYGEYSFAPVATGAAPDPCEKDALATLRTALPFHVQAYRGAVPACIDAGDVEPGTDILVVRRASTAVTALADLKANEVYMQTTADGNDAANPIIEFGLAPANFTLTKKDGTISDIRKYHVHIYFVSRCSELAAGANTCTAAADGGRWIPALKRLSLGIDDAGARKMRLDTIADGIERLQVDFGIDTKPAAAKDGAADEFQHANTVGTPGAEQWGDVMAARVYVLARSPDRSLEADDPKTYDLGTAGAAIAPGGPFRRHLFVSQVRIVNPSSRREAPE